MRWYELDVNAKSRAVSLRQQGTFAPAAPAGQPPSFRWMASPAIDKFGNINTSYIGGHDGFKVKLPGSGGAADIVGRVIGQNMAERTGQQVIVDNRAGAGSVIASEDRKSVV